MLAERLKEAGFNVDLQVMDWASVLARRAKKEGWSVYGVHAGGFDLGSPLTNVMVAFNCADFTGWQCDARITPLVEAFAKAPAEEDRKKIAGEIQSVMYDQAPGNSVGPVRAAGRLSRDFARSDTVRHPGVLER